MYSYHEDNTLPSLDEPYILVFGSNLMGRHGAGTAKVALTRYGARYGKGIGLHGMSYAIPTKNENMVTLSLNVIDLYVQEFKNHAFKSNAKFWITRIGCGLAGYSDYQIAPKFLCSPLNCNFPILWKDYLE